MQCCSKRPLRCVSEVTDVALPWQGCPSAATAPAPKQAGFTPILLSPQALGLASGLRQPRSTILGFAGKCHGGGAERGPLKACCRTEHTCTHSSQCWAGEVAFIRMKRHTTRPLIIYLPSPSLICDGDLGVHKCLLPIPGIDPAFLALNYQSL